jgi:maleate isomerase
MQRADVKLRRLGLLVPVTDMVSEVDFHHYLPPGVVFHSARLEQPENARIGTPENYQAMVDSAPAAAKQVAFADPELLVYCCTSASFYKGPEWHRTLSRQIEAAAGIPTVTASTAVLTALTAFKARRVFMASPYPESVNDAEVQFLNSHGFQVVGLLSFGCTRSKETVQVTHETIFSTIVERRSEYRDADVLFVSCTGFRAADVVEALETELNLPVITSNSASLWLALCRLGVDCSSVKLGRLFRQARTERVDSE